MRLLSALLLLAVAVAAPARAQSWPQKPVRLIVPTGPGAATDLMARVMAAAASQSIGGSIYVDNLPGASGIPAHLAAARAEPDGYTFLFSNTSGIAINPVSFKQLPYDAAKDFVVVSVVSDFGPQVVSANKDVPARTLAELIAYAKAHPALSYAVDATSGAGVFSGRLLNQRAAMGMQEVAYRSAGQMAQDVAGGQVPVLVSSVAARAAVRRFGRASPHRHFLKRTLPRAARPAERGRDGPRDGDRRVLRGGGAGRRSGGGRRAHEQGDQRLHSNAGRAPQAHGHRPRLQRAALAGSVGGLHRRRTEALARPRQGAADRAAVSGRAPAQNGPRATMSPMTLVSAPMRAA